MKSAIFALSIIVCAAQAHAATRAELIKASQEVVRGGMKDPESVRFRNIKVLNSITVCGEVNAKNSYGGYVGFQRFFVVAGAVAQVDDASNNPVFGKGYAEFCTTEAEKAREAERLRANAPPPPPPPPSDTEVEAMRDFFRTAE